MNTRKALLIADLDNTLYDWVTFFAQSFDAMVSELQSLLVVDRGQLLDEFKAVHQSYGSSEQPFAVFDLPSVKRAFPNAGEGELARNLDSAFHAFNSVRNRELALYPGVKETLEALAEGGVALVGHTEATSANAYFRLKKLGIERYFRHLYVAKGRPIRHPDPARAAALAPPTGFVSQLPAEERKPNPAVVLDICSREGVAPAEAVYVGDSLTKDVGMAHSAGVTAAWARYGTSYDRKLWELLVRVTHWTAEDAARESDLRRLPVESPDVVLDSFSEVLQLFGLVDRARSRVSAR